MANLAKVVTTDGVSPWQVGGRLGAQTVSVPNFMRAGMIDTFKANAERFSAQQHNYKDMPVFVETLKPFDADFQAAVLNGVNPQARGWVLSGMAHLAYTDAGKDLNAEVLDRVGATNILTARTQGDAVEYIALALLKGQKTATLIDLLVSPLSIGKTMHRLWWAGEEDGDLVAPRTRLIMAMTDTQLLTFVGRNPGLGEYYAHEGLIDKMPGVLDQLEANHGREFLAEAVLSSMPINQANQVLGNMNLDCKISVIQGWGSYLYGHDRPAAHEVFERAANKATELINGNPDILAMIEDGAMLPPRGYRGVY